ncbi:MAG: hypothetical protein HUJ27_15260 [Rhodobacteraceae bacterium]|nr:hypothetical protein [Paracoccaceae bacterium]
MERFLAGEINQNREVREFAFCYLEVDPYFFRSGYLLERIVRKLKKLEFTDAQKAIVQALILKRINTRALRNFREICRLMPKIETEEFRDRVRARLESDDPSVRHRAELAAAYL